jgi:hypothetical protein
MSLPPPQHRTPPPSSRIKLWRIAIIIYGTLALLLLTMPDEILSRLDDFEPTLPVRTAQTIVGAIATVSNTLGIPPAFHAVRNAVLTLAGVQQM